MSIACYIISELKRGPRPEVVFSDSLCRLAIFATLLDDTRALARIDLKKGSVASSGL